MPGCWEPNHLVYTPLLSLLSSPNMKPFQNSNEAREKALQVVMLTAKPEFQEPAWEKVRPEPCCPLIFRYACPSTNYIDCKDEIPLMNFSIVKNKEKKKDCGRDPKVLPLRAEQMPSG